MKNFYLIIPGNISKQLKDMVEITTKDINIGIITNDINLPDLSNKKIIFAIELNDIGYNQGIYDILSKLYERGSRSLKGSSAVILIHSRNELYTKSVAKNIIFIANQLGCRFPGHPIVEAIEGLKNFKTWQKTLNLSLEEICLELCSRLRKNFLRDNPMIIKNPKILALHASSYRTSNTLMLWNMIKQNITDCTLRELNVENGTITDCKGCYYTTCMHYSKKGSCFYGGTITQEILPAIEETDAIIWICPNYNDAISANLTAVINRMTVLYRKTRFYNKTVFGVIVSGSSGSDSVAKQLIGALNINKSFRLPPYFSIRAIANDPGTIMRTNNIEEKAKSFAENIMLEIKA